MSGEDVSRGSFCVVGSPHHCGVSLSGLVRWGGAMEKKKKVITVGSEISEIHSTRDEVNICLMINKNYKTPAEIN